MKADNIREEPGMTMRSKVRSNENLLRLSLQMILDEFDELLWDYEAHGNRSHDRFRGVQLYYGQRDLERDQIYVVPEQYASRFPSDRYSFITTAEMDGISPGVSRINQPQDLIISVTLKLFQRYYAFEASVNSLVANEGTLSELCVLASDFFGNPIYIHDNVFTVIAMSGWVQGMMEFEYNRETQRYNVPLAQIEEYKFNQKYQETYRLHRAGIWDVDQYPYGIRSMFINLWNGDVFLGRMLMDELVSSFRPGSYTLLEYLGGHATRIFLKTLDNRTGAYRNLEDSVRDILDGHAMDPTDLTLLLTALGWKHDDEFLCLKLQSQKSDIYTASEHVFRYSLTTVFPNSFTFFHKRRLCLLIDLTVSGLSQVDVRQLISPVARDSYLYVGLSMPVHGTGQWMQGFLQANIALDYGFRWRSDRWVIPFHLCALDHILDSTQTPLPQQHLVARELLELKTYDRQKGTNYYETLRSYLRNERDITRASQDLIIHRTTLLYRLKKMETIVNINLESPEMRLYLLLSIYMLERSENFWLEDHVD